eukprot:GILK01009014.1.p1 GENE.GILK01009014.1~~GILK01009014.1.p1  ORF type:complete len:472 (+),score=47.66 GILK01009014.1:134-1417(+)
MPTARHLATQAKPKVIVISGPTGIGKSSVALKLAQEMNGEIISADSVQVYRGLDIGSNKATPAERQLVPHHLIDIADPTVGQFSAGDFFREARRHVREITERGRVPIVAGGTAFYLQFFINGLPIHSRRSTSSSEQDWATKDLQQIYDEVYKIDPIYAAAHSTDRFRLLRALDVSQSTKSPLKRLAYPRGSFDGIGSQNPYVNEFDFRCFFLTGPRVDINRRIDFRCEQMVKQGLLIETANLMREGLTNNRVTRLCIGYRQAIDYLSMEPHEIAKDEHFVSFLDDFMQASRSLVKSQFIWFRKESSFWWVPMQLSPQSVHDVDSAAKFIGELSTLSEETYKLKLLENKSEQAKLLEESFLSGKAMRTYRSDKILFNTKENRRVEIDRTLTALGVAVNRVTDDTVTAALVQASTSVDSSSTSTSTCAA